MRDLVGDRSPLIVSFFSIAHCGGMYSMDGAMRPSGLPPKKRHRCDGDMSYYSHHITENASTAYCNRTNVNHVPPDVTSSDIYPECDDEPLDLSQRPNQKAAENNADGRLLWEFLDGLLQDDRYQDYVRWEDEGNWIFRIVNPHGLANLWGLQKHKHNMNYEKLSRALRYYYKMNIIAKVPKHRLTYRFMTPPKCIKKGIRGAKPGVPHVRRRPVDTTTAGSGGHRKPPKTDKNNLDRNSIQCTQTTNAQERTPLCVTSSPSHNDVMLDKRVQMAPQSLGSSAPSIRTSGARAVTSSRHGSHGDELVECTNDVTLPVFETRVGRNEWPSTDRAPSTILANHEGVNGVQLDSTNCDSYKRNNAQFSHNASLWSRPVQPTYISGKNNHVYNKDIKHHASYQERPQTTVNKNIILRVNDRESTPVFLNL